MAPAPDAGSTPAAPAGLTPRERAVVLVLAAVQFTHMVDFVIIMPLGKRLMAELGITTDQFGYVIAVYGLLAAAATLLASTVVDRFDRKSVLLVMYAGFAASTLCCGLAPTYAWLLVARGAAGAFGGLAAAILMAILADLFPPAKRGRATGGVMSAFAVASVVGLPVGLELAGQFGRGAPFVALAALSVVVWAVAWWQLPAVRRHITAARPDVWAEFKAVAREPAHLRAFAFSLTLVFGTFSVAAYIGPFLMTSNGWDEQDVKWVYLAAGVCTFVSMNLIGRLADRLPRRPLFVLFGSVALVMGLVVSNLPPVPLWVAAVAVSLFMVSASGRMVPAQAMLLGVAAPRVRGAFVTLNTTVQHVGMGLAPMVGGLLLWERADKTLGGYPLVGLVAAGASALSLVLSGRIRPTAGTAGTTAVALRVEAAEPVAV